MNSEEYEVYLAKCAKEELQLRQRGTPHTAEWAEQIRKIQRWTKIEQDKRLHRMLPLAFEPIEVCNVRWNIKRLREFIHDDREPYCTVAPDLLDGIIAACIQRYIWNDIWLEKGVMKYGMDARAYLTTGDWNAPGLGDTMPRDIILDMVEREIRGL